MNPRRARPPVAQAVLDEMAPLLRDQAQRYRRDAEEADDRHQPGGCTSAGCADCPFGQRCRRVPPAHTHHAYGPSVRVPGGRNARLDSFSAPRRISSLSRSSWRELEALIAAARGCVAHMKKRTRARCRSCPFFGGGSNAWPRTAARVATVAVAACARRTERGLSCRCAYQAPSEPILQMKTRERCLGWLHAVWSYFAYSASRARCGIALVQYFCFSRTRACGV